MGFTINGNRYSLEEIKALWPDGVFTIGSIDISNLGLAEIPFKILRCRSFDCSYNLLTSLENGPEKVENSYWCNNNQLTSLKGVPKAISGHFDCSYNFLASLENGPKKVNGSYWCNNNQLTTLKGVSKKISGNFNCNYNNLTSLEGGPKKVYGNYWCNNNKLHDFEKPFKLANEDEQYFINGEQLTKEAWEKHPLVIEHKIKELLKQ